ncbi:uncharacterized protein AB675_6751 [Cyphellophora attinorum]|uniref:G-protein coupled receptors family 2 profile 2 domain-containing protein n=1 Tax=Cyphellophora attinorum TaxID=1664694 RepID=A0A0N1H8Y1_9EURO|nr:uncharacterized protein AB675_6751 [Phialophora attinorum]KPI43655.1 hypothetical protein AB675_6751 [Phialophora attinorum]
MVDHNTGIEIAERVSSVFSVLGAVLIITTFLYDNRFRKPVNRLVFYASWGNLFANVATLISREGIKRGIDGPLCQFQGFLIQWFMPADALWTFAMACNVYLTFFKQYDSISLRKLEWRYLAICYGLPLIPALTFLCIDTRARGKIYGSANLWCWITREWNGLRIGAFYGPVWIIILFDIFIYIKVGMIVFKWRKSLVSLGTRTNSKSQEHTYEPKITERPRYEINVSSAVPHSRSRSLTGNYRPNSISSTAPFSPSHTRNGSNEQRLSDQSTQVDTRVNTTISYQPSTTKGSPRVVDANRATLQYCYTSCLFLCALIITWVPSTINRLYTLVRPNEAVSPYGLDLSSALVLPLQGFWNMVIYIVTSWTACRALWKESTPEYSCFSDSSRRPSGHKLQHLGSTDFRSPGTTTAANTLPKDPFPLSPLDQTHFAKTEYGHGYNHSHSHSLSTDYAYNRQQQQRHQQAERPSSPPLSPLNAHPPAAPPRPSLATQTIMTSAPTLSPV